MSARSARNWGSGWWLGQGDDRTCGWDRLSQSRILRRGGGCARASGLLGVVVHVCVAENGPRSLLRAVFFVFFTGS